MGADQFFTVSKGKTAQQAFNEAVTQAQYEHGHAGYSGTIAEKTSFTEIPLPVGMNPNVYAEQLIDKGDERVDDKWGPAGCFKIAQDLYMFFGWASS